MKFFSQAHASEKGQDEREEERQQDEETLAAGGAVVPETDSPVKRAVTRRAVESNAPPVEMTGLPINGSGELIRAVDTGAVKLMPARIDHLKDCTVLAARISPGGRNMQDNTSRQLSRRRSRSLA